MVFCLGFAKNFTPYTGGTAEVLGGTLVGTVYNVGTFIVCGCTQVNEIQAHPQGNIRVTSPISSTWVLDLTFDSSLSYPDGYVIMEGYDGYQRWCGELE